MKDFELTNVVWTEEQEPNLHNTLNNTLKKSLCFNFNIYILPCFLIFLFWYVKAQIIFTDDKKNVG